MNILGLGDKGRQQIDKNDLIQNESITKFSFDKFCSQTTGMKVTRHTVPLIRTASFFTGLQGCSPITKSIQTVIKFGFTKKPKTSNQGENPEKIITYTPIRPLKKNLTTLYVQKRFLNNGLVMKRTPFWPYLSPFYAMLINIYLTNWSFINCSITSVLLIVGLLIRMGSVQRRQRQIIKLQSSHDLSKLYITVNASHITKIFAQNYPTSVQQIQDDNLILDAELSQLEQNYTEEDKNTLKEEEIQNKKNQLKDKIFKNIMSKYQRQQSIMRFKLDSSKTTFMLSQKFDAEISNSKVLQPPIQNETKDMFDVPYKYLIVRTEFLFTRRKLPYHFYINLEENGDLKYHDYLTALGANYKISLDKEIK